MRFVGRASGRVEQRVHAPATLASPSPCTHDRASWHRLPLGLDARAVQRVLEPGVARTAHDQQRASLAARGPVRPLRCVYISASDGGSSGSQASISGTSMPRAATSGRDEDRHVPLRKCIERARGWPCARSPRAAARRSGRRRVARRARWLSTRRRTKTSVRAPSVSSSRVTPRGVPLVGAHQMRDVLDVTWRRRGACPRGGARRAESVREVLRTCGGKVAESRWLRRSSGSASRMASSSSRKPMSNI